MKNYSTNFLYKQVASSEIYSDPEYQRNLDYKRVHSIVAHFNPSLVNPVKVSLRDGKYWVFDGQHTLAALKALNGGKDVMVDCKVYTGLTQQDEAKLFSEQNGIARAVESNAKMKALYTAGDVEIRELHSAITSMGIKFDFSKSKSAYKVTACATAYKIFKSTSRTEFQTILTVIRDAWGGEPDSFNKEILYGMYIFCDAYWGKMDAKRAVSQLKKVSPVEIIRNGKLYRENGLRGFAWQILNAYNKNLRAGRLDEEPLNLWPRASR